MAYDKIVDSMELDALFTAIADAIRSKHGGAARYVPGQMAQAILDIASGVDTSDATATDTQVVSGATYYARGSKRTGNVSVTSNLSRTLTEAHVSAGTSSAPGMVSFGIGSRTFLHEYGVVTVNLYENAIIKLYGYVSTASAAMLNAYQEGVDSV